MSPLTPIFILAIIFLLALNAFFVLAEFASVKVRPTQIDVLALKGNRNARLMQHVQANLDEYLSVCQVGITLASIGLGFVGEPAFTDLIRYVFFAAGFAEMNREAAHAIAITLGYLFISYLHIVIGELFPKSVAIRSTEKSALLIAYPLRFFHSLFITPIWLLNSSVNAILNLLHIPVKVKPETHSEEEIRVILNKSQLSSTASFVRPFVLLARLKEAVPEGENESVKYLFILLTPAKAPRLHQLILARIAAVFESDFLITRMDAARSPGELFSIVMTTEQTTDL